jgi:hypothetical protein
MSLAQDVLNAIAEGLGEFTLPAGDVVLDDPLIIPAGTRNFALRGVQTVLRPQFDGPAIRVGSWPQLHNNWMITGDRNVKVIIQPKHGAQSLTVEENVEPGWAVLWDTHKIVCAKIDDPNNVPVSMNHAELVCVVSCSGGVAYLKEPIGREFVGDVYLLPEYQVCENIEVSDISCDSAYRGGMLQVGLSTGVSLHNLEAIHFTSDAISLNTCKSVQVSGCRVSSAKPGGAGSGYGFSCYRSRRVFYTNCRGSGCRHSFMFHSGSMDCQCYVCAAENGFDLHGYDERRIALYRCTGDGGDIGNDAWLGGAKDVLVKSCSFMENFGIHANAEGVRCVDSSFNCVRFFSVEDSWEGANPRLGWPSRVRFDRCGISLLEFGARSLGKIEWHGCKFSRGSTIADIAGQDFSELYIKQCTFEAPLDQIVQLRECSPAAYVFLIDCAFKTAGAVAVWVASSYRGHATTEGCSLDGPGVLVKDDRQG